MPSWDYECQECGERFVITAQSINDHKRNPECPKCGSTETEQTWDDGKAPHWSFK